ncbi:hypothetical protein [Curtobacterium sp. MCPF17_003]|uniref:hypothetical protein n=1 Tax=Curtobacterium sp. MCPF17_003 TaxID=2175637 RepID=UPI0015E894F5|nr:hypothetical protein [Curtobacterium sp. MCPF17_003]
MTRNPVGVVLAEGLQLHPGRGVEVARLDLLGDLRVVVARTDRLRAVRVAVFPVVARGLTEAGAGVTAAVPETTTFITAVATRAVRRTAAERTVGGTTTGRTIGGTTTVRAVPVTSRTVRATTVRAVAVSGGTVRTTTVRAVAVSSGTVRATAVRAVAVTSRTVRATTERTVAVTARPVRGSATVGTITVSSGTFGRSTTVRTIAITSGTVRTTAVRAVAITSGTVRGAATERTVPITTRTVGSALERSVAVTARPVRATTTERTITVTSRAVRATTVRTIAIAPRTIGTARTIAARRPTGVTTVALPRRPVVPVAGSERTIAVATRRAVPSGCAVTERTVSTLRTITTVTFTALELARSRRPTTIALAAPPRSAVATGEPVAVPSGSISAVPVVPPLIVVVRHRCSSSRARCSASGVRPLCRCVGCRVGRPTSASSPSRTGAGVERTAAETEMATGPNRERGLPLRILDGGPMATSFIR